MFIMKPEKPMPKGVELHLEQDDDGVAVYDNAGYAYATFTPEGVILHASLPSDEGLPVNKRGRLLLVKET